jgi:hypothetical protein
MVQKALEGDTKAAEWVAARAFPKTRLVQFELPDIQSAADAEKALGAVLQAVAAGKLSVEEGDKLAGTIGRLGESVHMRLVEDRLNALEAAQPATVTSYERIAERSGGTGPYRKPLARIGISRR